MKNAKTMVMTLVLVLLAALSAAEPIPTTINYQGYLGNLQGNPLPDGTYTMTFRLYDLPSGGQTLWTELRDDNVSVNDGRFHVELGDLAPFANAGVKFNQELYLEIEIDTYGSLLPRLKFAAAPYSFRAANIEAAGALAGHRRCDGRGPRPPD